MTAKQFWITPTDDDDGVWLTFTFSADVVAALKSKLPTRARRWDPSQRAWWIDERYEGRIRQIMQRLGLTEFEEGAGDGRAILTVNKRDAWRVLWLQPGAPDEVVKAVFRALAKMNHPDHGGDVREMQRINSAYDTLAGGGR